MQTFLNLVRLIGCIAALTAAQAQGQQVAYTDIQQLLGSSQAARTADQQIRVVYRSDIERFEKRSRVLQIELNDLVSKFQTVQATNPNSPSLSYQASIITKRQDDAKRELAELGANLERVNSYVLSQIDAYLDAAVTRAMAKRGVLLLVQRSAVIKNTPGTDLTPYILAELDALVQSVSVVPPSGWTSTTATAASPAITFSTGNTNNNVPSHPSTRCAENGSCYGDLSPFTGNPKTIEVKGYYRSDGTYVRGHYRSRGN